MSLLTPTPGQTVGPFFGYALPYDGDNQLVPHGFPGAIRLHGTVSDGAGAPIPDALLEIWQADADGRVVHEEGSISRDGWTFTGFGRTCTDDMGRYTFTTVEPGPTAPDSPAFFAVTVFSRGLLNRLFTRAYVPGPALTSDRLPAGLPDDRRSTLIAERDQFGYRFDIRLQGADETVFLRYPGH